MKKNWFGITILLVVFSMVTTVALAQQESHKGKGAISRRKFKRLAKEENTIVIDVRTPEEYNAGHIPDALLMDFKNEEFTNKVQALDKSKRYLLYCRTGKRSALAVEIFRRQGFDKVYHLKGGTEDRKDPLQ